MTITVRYNQDGSIAAVIDGIEMTVPDVLGNRHRQIIAAWEAFGNTIEPYASTAQNILAAPADLFGGPTLKETFDGN